MNIDDCSESRSCAVESKYFTHKSDMDESLSDFQETKKNFSGPKATAKKNSNPRNAPKRPRGQKDIRTALRSKKNELESYSKDFDKVCKKAGIDVDSEQLQLAIALSKSLQSTTLTPNDSAVCLQTTTTQDRIGKIRTTLQEYGFKVPKIKIAGNTRKIRKHRKDYKLLQTSENERKEIIANKYSQVLFQNINLCSLDCLDIDAADIPLYYLASNATYDVLQITDTFYGGNLIERATSTGNLLRDWSKIPGRPESPHLFEPMSMNFSEIECSQDELDFVLSGSLKRCKDIVQKKMINCTKINKCKLAIEDNTVVNRNEDIIKHNQDYTLTVDNEDVVLIDKPILSVNKHGSCSPDMFDDDASDINICDNDINNLTTLKNNSSEIHMTNANLGVLDHIKPFFEKSKLYPNRNVTNIKPIEMELTECIQIQDECAPVGKISQENNATKRKTNDYMELTECVAISSQPIRNKIDLTLSPDIVEEITSKDATDKNNLHNSMSINPTESYNIDLTKDPEIEDGGGENKNTPKLVDQGKGVESMDLTQSSNTSDELPFISLTASKNKSLDDTLIVDIYDYARVNMNTDSTAHIDLTQNIQREESITHSQTFFEEYDHDHSDSPEMPKESNSGVTQNNNKIYFTHTAIDSQLQLKYDKRSNSQSIKEPILVECHPSNALINNVSKVTLMLSPIEQYDADDPNDDIDLTQISDTSEKFIQITPNNTKGQDNTDASDEYLTQANELPTVRNEQRCSSLGKKDEISIDYDEFIITENEELAYSKNSNHESIVYENSDKNVIYSRSNSFILSCSHNSEIFDISDKELDYSLHKSKLEILGDNFALGGISVTDELDLGASKKCITDDISITNEMDIESFPAINIKNSKYNEISPIKHRRITEIATPQKACNSNMVTTVFTPKKSEMIIKINNVTPMKDYESMATPDIHKELDKYGIKPFKRKRAIQLLTHIYNETHPIIECADDFASPPKRRKPNEDEPTCRKCLLPRKLLTSPTESLKDTHKCNENVLDIGKQNENNFGQNSKGNNCTRKGKGIGKKSKESVKKSIESDKKSLERVKKDLAEKAVGASLGHTQNSKEIVSNEAPISKEIECIPEDWVFQKREKAKVHSCRVPLHIAFYNYVSSRRELREAILCYEPVEIDLIHKDLVGFGHRYDPKDLLKFLDKKCITVKTTDNEARNVKR